MNRTPYRRRTPPRNGAEDGYRHEHASEGSESISAGETLIMQCIICGIIMIFVLIAGMTDIAPAAALRGGIQQILSGAETLDELIADVRQFGADWLDWDLPYQENAAPDEFYMPTSDYPEDPPTYNLEQATYPYTYYEHINPDHLSPAANDQVSNLTVPEPPVTPGLWD